MDFHKLSRNELVAECKKANVKGHSGKKKEELIQLLTNTPARIEHVPNEQTQKKQKQKDLCRLNYIGSKFLLLDWLKQSFLEKTGLPSFESVRFADLFAGTGVVSHFLRQQKAITISNDAELYSSVITHALACSSYSDTLQAIITSMNTEVTERKHIVGEPGFITRKYSPHDTNERMFFTKENAQRIDYIRKRIEERTDLSENDQKFLLASLILSADAVSNVPAVYGCYLKKFKTKATKDLVLQPIHTYSVPPHADSQNYHSNVLSNELVNAVNADIVYLDPPYNERQYSKNYFPLNMIALSPNRVEQEELKGKTGIPGSCFMSPFCKKDQVEGAFRTVFQKLKSKWIFVSYNSESLLKKEAMLKLMSEFGEASVIEREYKRFKAYEYNQDVKIQEYLFALRVQR